MVVCVFFFFKQKTAYEMRISDGVQTCARPVMNKIIVATLFAGAAALTSPAFAQDTNSTFTGPRVEGLIGYDHVGAGSDIDNDNGRDDPSVDGLPYGLGFGYGIAVGGAGLGVGGELTDIYGNSENRRKV